MSKIEKAGEAGAEGLRLYLISHMGNYPCWSMEVAANPGQAFQKCRTSKRLPDSSDKTSCKVEEVRIPGYRIVVLPEEG